MGVESASDLADFFNTSDFGVAATYTPSGGSASTINVIFDKPFSSVPLDTGEQDVESNTPTALCISSDVSSVAHGDALVVSATTYSVVGVQKSAGSGFQDSTLLILEEQ
tara:strand:- start:1309 stop:1635 length:327 start_codon:yes stop_codon:yes gene_type:complete